MATVDEYLQTWNLKLSTTKSVSATYHLNNKDAKRELEVKYNNETLPFCSEPKYLGVTLGRSLTYRRHLESLHNKLTSRIALLRRLAGSGCGAVATTLRIASGLPESTTAGFCFFLSDQDLDPESKICEKTDPDAKSLFSLGSNKSLCGHFTNKNMGKLRLHRWLQPESEQESDSQNWRIAGSGLKNFGTRPELESEKVTVATFGSFRSVSS